jgi:hypothetical protein
MLNKKKCNRKKKRMQLRKRGRTKLNNGKFESRFIKLAANINN